MEIKISNKLSELDTLNRNLTAFGQRHSLTSNVVRDLNLALEEIFTNIVSCAYTDDREHEITVRLSVQAEEVTAEVEDDGQSFNPLQAPEADIMSPLEERTIGGLGIHLVRKLMDAMAYKREGDKNLLTLKKLTGDS
jgi:anti-sigma regulatory factor (Ser/Thr protein kinase)